MKVSEVNPARIIDDCVDQIIHEGRTFDDVVRQHPELKADLQDALEAAFWLSSQPDPGKFTARFVQKSKSRLMSRLSAHPRPAQNHWGFLRSFGTLGFRTALIGVFVVVFAGFTGVVYAAKLALPGENLYQVKMVLEDWQGSLIQDQDGRTAFRLVQIDTRLSEIDQIIALSDTQNINLALSEYENAVQKLVVEFDNLNNTDNQKEQLAMRLQQKLIDHLNHLEQLRAKLPDQAQKGIDRAITVSSHGLTTAQYAVQKDHPSNKAGTTPTVTITPSDVIESPQPATKTPRKTITVQSDEISPTEKVKDHPSKTPEPTDKPAPMNENKPTQKPKPTHPDTGAPPGRGNH